MTINYAHGQAFGQMVASAVGQIASQGDPSIGVYGAWDREVGYSTKTKARDWAAGWGSANYDGYFDFGDAQGCVKTDLPRGQDFQCDNAWMESDVAYLSWSNGAYPLPEIYSASTKGDVGVTDASAREWQALSYYTLANLGCYTGGGHQCSQMWIEGALSDHTDCKYAKPASSVPTCLSTHNFQPMAWRDLFDTLNSNDSTRQFLTYASEIHHLEQGSDEYLPPAQPSTP